MTPPAMDPRQETRTDRIIGQLSYVGEELDLLAKFLPRIDPVILTQQPVDGDPSVLETFQQMAQYQEALNSSLGLQPVSTEESDDDDLLSLLLRFKSGRDVLVAHVQSLSTLSDEVLLNGDLLETTLYKFILEESSLMRRVTARLHESNLFRL